MAKWTAQPQEREGSYHFSGQFFVTIGVRESLTWEEIANIAEQIRELIQTNNGIDYLLVFENDEGDKLFFIDQLNKEMIESGQFREEDNYCTLMFAYEY